MAEEFLNFSQVGAVLQEVGCERVAQGMRCGCFGQAKDAADLAHGFLCNALV